MRRPAGERPRATVSPNSGEFDGQLGVLGIWVPGGSVCVGAYVIGGGVIGVVEAPDRDRGGAWEIAGFDSDASIGTFTDPPGPLSRPGDAVR
jgi:hypothetical protein